VTLLKTLGQWWRQHGFRITVSYRMDWTGYTKGGRMLFRRPVGRDFPISADYGDWGPWWSKHIDPSGMWTVGQVDGMGQHKGIDFKTPDQTMVHAMADGVVVAAGWENPSKPTQGFGLRVRQQIKSDGITFTLVYGHLSQLYVRPGQKIRTGDRVAFSGIPATSPAPTFTLN
jgi:murein DD-endopeptidase MepM/ murein hydrolase activator NlpD